MGQHCQRTRLQAISTGLMFLLSGGALWAAARGWYSFRDAIPWWPLGFLFPAVHYLTAPAPERDVPTALLWAALAAGLVAWNLGHVPFSLPALIPLILVVGGARLLYMGLARARGTE